MCFICGKKQHLSLKLRGNVVCGDHQGTETGGEAGWVVSDVNDATSRGGGRLKRTHAHHFKSHYLQTAQEKEEKGESGWMRG